MENFVQLERYQLVELRNAGVDHRLGIGRDGHRALHHLIYKLAQHVLAALLARRIFTELGFFDDLIQQPHFLRNRLRA